MNIFPYKVKSLFYHGFEHFWKKDWLLALEDKIIVWKMLQVEFVRCTWTSYLYAGHYLADGTKLDTRLNLFGEWQCYTVDEESLHYDYNSEHEHQVSLLSEKEPIHSWGGHYAVHGLKSVLDLIRTTSISAPFSTEKVWLHDALGRIGTLCNLSLLPRLRALRYIGAFRLAAFIIFGPSLSADLVIAILLLMKGTVFFSIFFF